MMVLPIDITYLGLFWQHFYSVDEEINMQDSCVLRELVGETGRKGGILLYCEMRDRVVLCLIEHNFMHCRK